MLKEQDMKKILDRLETEYPDAACALTYKDLYQLLVKVTLSAQTTDISVNGISSELFEKYPDAYAMAEAETGELEHILRPVGMYRTKAKNITAQAAVLRDVFGGKVPDDYESLVSLPGVGRKTANVVLSVGFGHQRIAVDTHVFRVANRMGLVNEKTVFGTEKALMKAVPEERWTATHHSLVFHGRNCCHARNPECGACVINDLCMKRGV